MVPLSHPKKAMFQRPAFDPTRNSHLGHSLSLDSSMSSTPATPNTASVVTSTALGPLSSSGEPSQETSSLGSVPHSAIYEVSHLSRPSSIVSSVVENGSLSSSSCGQHLIPSMYGNGSGGLFGNNNAAPSALVMTPPSPYNSEMAPSIMGSENGLMQHASSWYHNTMHRPQHHGYSEMMSDWTNPMCANSGFAPANSSLSACAYQMSLPGAYSSPISSVYHHNNHHRPSTGSTIDYLEPRFNTSYHHPYYNNLFSSGSPTGGNHSLTPLTVGTEMNLNQMPFPTSSLLNSSPDSGLTASSDGNESPSLAQQQHNSDNQLTMLAGSNLPAGLLNRNHGQSGCELDDDVKPNLSLLPVNGPAQEANSTTSSNSTGASNASTHLNMYNWMKKSSNSSSSQSSTGKCKTRTKDKYRVVYTETQRVELEKEFHFSRYITIKRKSELAHQLNLSERQVKIWFQNRRAKDRKQQRKRDEIMKKDNKKESCASTNSHSGALLSVNASTPGVLVSSGGVPAITAMGNSCNNNLLVTSISGNTIHHHTGGRTAVPTGQHFPGHHSLHSPQMGAIQTGYRDMLSASLTPTTPTISEMAH